MATKTVGNTTLTYEVATSESRVAVVVTLDVTKSLEVTVPAGHTMTVSLSAAGSVGSLGGSGNRNVTLRNNSSSARVMTATATIPVITNRTIFYDRQKSAYNASLSFRSSSDSGSVSINVPALASYTVSYNANGGSGAPASQTKYQGITLTLQSTKPTKTGHTFSTWNTNSSGTGTNYAAGGSYTANAAVTLYAKYTVNKYTISYSANGGSGTVASQTKTYNVALNLQNGSTFSKKGTLNGAVVEYRLVKWNTKPDGTGTDYALGSAAPNITANLSLYAVWELKYIYPTIRNIKIERNDTADISDVTETDDGTYIRISFDWTECSEDGGVTTDTPNCVISIGEDEYTPTLTSNFTFKPSTEYSSDEAFRIIITLTDPNYASSTATINTIAATAILPIDLCAYQDNSVCMGIMHPVVEGQTVTFPSKVHLQTDLDQDDVTALYIKNDEKDVSMWVGISRSGVGHGLHSNYVSRWMIQQADADTLNIAGNRINIDKDGDVKFNFKDNAQGRLLLSHGLSNKEAKYIAERTDKSVAVWFGIGSGGTNHGVFSQKLNKWLIYGDGDTNSSNYGAVYVNGINTANIVQQSQISNFVSKSQILSVTSTLVDNKTVSGGSTTGNLTKDLTKSGYKPLIMTVNIRGATTGGKNASGCYAFYQMISGNTATVNIANRFTSDAVIKVEITVLYSPS